MMHSCTRSPAQPTGLLCLLLAMLTVGCADEQNPVIPSSGDPGTGGGSSSSGKSDGGTGASEAGQPAADSAGDQVGSDALLGPLCNLLAQDCIDSGDGCYPVGGMGMCLRAGIHTELMTCLVHADNQQDCDRGLVCVLLSGLGAQGLCEPLCDLTDRSARVCSGRTCAQPEAYPKGVGHCTSD